MVIEEDPGVPEVPWYAEWGLRGSSSGTEHSSADLAEIVEAVLDETRSLTDRYTVRLDWELTGEPPGGRDGGGCGR
jgi:hypothetical protein